MRRIARSSLPANDALALAKQQQRLNSDRKNGPVDLEKRWKNERRKSLMRRVHGVLCTMAGPAQRCMYCLDSHGTDIEHWQPKALWPERMFVWENLLLCCGECGRLKGKKFPLDATGNALFLDPTQDDPWRHLDFDPPTGMLTPRFDLASSTFDRRGEATTLVLRFGHRDALHEQYRKTWRRLGEVIQAVLAQPGTTTAQLLAKLRAADDHNLLPWCFSDRGARESPFLELRAQQPTLFAECAQEVDAP